MMINKFAIRMWPHEALPTSLLVCDFGCLKYTGIDDPFSAREIHGQHVVRAAQKFGNVGRLEQRSP